MTPERLEERTRARCPKCKAVTEFYHPPGKSPFPSACLIELWPGRRRWVGEQCLNVLTEADVCGQRGIEHG